MVTLTISELALFKPFTKSHPGATGKDFNHFIRIRREIQAL